jgi:abortive infection bacteriophage resistance protein
MSQVGKPFLSLEKQIEKLSSRGLEILSVDNAKQQLLRTTYYDLINGYKDVFLVEKIDLEDEDQYISGTTFEDILDLYNLDREIRHATLEVLLDVECIFYSSLAYCLSEIYGEKQEDYLKKENYRLGRKQKHNNRFERDNLLWKIGKKINEPDEQPLKYYKEQYGNIPPWILVKGLSFGELVMLYRLSSDVVKSNVIMNIIGREASDHDKEFFLKSMEIFNRYRNLAAHGGRIYNNWTNFELPYNPELFRILGIEKAAHNKGRGRNDYAAFTIGLLFFFQNNARGMLEFIIYLEGAMSEYQKKQPSHYEWTLTALGIPSNYYRSFLGSLGL